jgi:hypothetical protein
MSLVGAVVQAVDGWRVLKADGVDLGKLGTPNAKVTR